MSPQVIIPSIPCSGECDVTCRRRNMHVQMLRVRTSSPDLAKSADIDLQCTSTWNATSSMFRYNITWTLDFPPYVMAALSTATVGLLGTDRRGPTYSPQISVSISVCQSTHLLDPYCTCSCACVRRICQLAWFNCSVSPPHLSTSPPLHPHNRKPTPL